MLINQGHGALAPPPQYPNVLYFYCIWFIIQDLLKPSSFNNAVTFQSINKRGIKLHIKSPNEIYLSDHYLVEMNLNITKHKQPSKYTVKRCLRNIDINAFKSEVVDIGDNIMIGSDISPCIELLNKTLRTLIDKHALLKRTCIKTRPHPWYTMIFTKLSYIEGLLNVNGE